MRPVSLVIAAMSLSISQAQITAFSYQGQLADGSGPANGIYDVRFSLYGSTNCDDQPVAGPITNAATSVTQGVFFTSVDFGTGACSGAQLWLQLDVRTNGASTFMPLSPRQPLLAVPYAVMAGGASNLLGTVAAAQLSGAIPTTQLSGTIPTTQLSGSIPTAQLSGSIPTAQLSGTMAMAQLPGSVLTNGATGVTLQGVFSGNGSGLTNLNHLTANAPYTYSHANPALGLWTVSGDGNTVPLFTVSQDSGNPDIDATASTWGYDGVNSLTYNAGRFFGESWNWQLQAPGTDVRALILKGAASQHQSEGAYFILETAASSTTPGPHGLFNNPMYTSRNGLVALGNLTDESDQDASLPIESYLTGWVNIFPSGSTWSKGTATLPPLVISPQTLVPTAVANSVENDGTSWWLTDGSGNRAKIVTTTLTTPFYAHVDGTNVFFSTQP